MRDVKIISRLSLRGSKEMVLPLAIFFCCAPSADVMFEDVERTYSQAADRDEDGEGTLGKSSF